jgi:hypothetical protein
MILLGKLIAMQFVPDSFSDEEIGEWVDVTSNHYQIFSKGKVGEIVEDDTNHSAGEYMYYNQKWLLIQEITPVK